MKPAYLGVVVLLSFAGGCAGDGSGKAPVAPGDDGGGGGGTIDYEKQVQPIFTKNCSCHQSFSAPQGEVLVPGSSYDALVSVRSTENPSILRVKPGDPDSSYLVIKIDDGVPDVGSRRVGDRMPRGMPPLQSDEIRTIRQWIQEGARRTAAPGDSLDKEPPRFNGATLAVPAGPSTIDVFWDTASDGKTPANEIIYRIFLARESGKQDLLVPDFSTARGARSFRVENLEPATRYFIVVRAQDAAGNQDSNTVEVSAETAPAPPPPSGPVDFETQVQPIFTKSCSCHQSVDAPLGEVLLSGSSYDALVQVRSVESPALLRVKPGDPDSSYLVIKIDDGVPDVGSRRVGERMPRGMPPLRSEEIRTIRQWILEGALRSGAAGGSTDAKPPRFGGATGAIAASPYAIDVFWDPAADDRSPASEISYRVFVARRSGGQDFLLPDFASRRGASSQRLEGLEPGTRYFIVVRAEDAAGNQDSNRVEVSAETAPAPPPPPGAVDFETQVQPIFTRNCSCHQSFSAPQGEVLLPGAAYDALVGVRSAENPAILRVKPGDPDSSYLVIKIDDEVLDVASRRIGERMPFGLPALRAEEIRTIRQWIAEGARRTAGSGGGQDTEAPRFGGATRAVAVGPDAIDVLWSPATDDETAPEEISYKVFVATESGMEDFLLPDFNAPRGATSLRLGNLEPATRYFIVVRAQDAAGNQDTNTVEVNAVTAAAPPPPSSGVDFEKNVQPIFTRSCACHQSPDAPQGEVLLPGASYDSLVNVRSTESSSLLRVKPGDPNRSYLVIKIDDNTPNVNTLRVGERMPRGLPALGVGDIQTIRRWISEGARRTPSGGATDSEPPRFGGATRALTVGPDSIDVFWDAAADNVTPATDISYKIFTSTQSGGQSFALPDFSSPRGARSLRLTGLAAGTRYFVVVRAQDVAGNQDSNRVEANASTAPLPPPPTGPVDFETQVQPIFTKGCACHQTTAAPQGEVLLPGSSYDSLVNVRSTESSSILRVKPGDPDSSYLVIKIDDNTPNVSTLRVGERMPRGLPPLGGGDIQTIRQWIQEGALRSVDPGGGADTEPPRFGGVTRAAAVGPDSVDVFWDAASDNVTLASDIAFKVFISTQSGRQDFALPDFTSPRGARSLRLTGLQPSTLYFIVVRALDAAGNQDSNRVEASATTASPPPPPAGGVDFDTQVLPILRRNCVRCHGGFSAGSCSGILGRCFDSYEAIQATSFDGREVIPFDGGGSELVKRIRGLSLPRMPFDGPPFLTEQEIVIVESWIDAGAKPSAPPAGNRPPVADAGGPYSGTVGAPVTFSAAASFDPDGDALAFEWDFGDGTKGTGMSPQHAYSLEGAFTVSLVVRDAKGLSTPDAATATVVRKGLFPTDPTMERVCSQCHGVRIVLEDGTTGEITPAGKGLAFFPPGFFMTCNVRSAQGWRDTVERMRNVNKCPMTLEEENAILSFLGASYAGGDPRADTFTRACSQCHSPSIPTSVPRSPEQWERTVDRMIRRYEAGVTAGERADIIGYLSTVARGTPPTELPEPQARVYMNLVCTSCHSPERVMDDSTGLPDEDFRSFGDALELTREMMSKGCGLPGVTDVIIARWLSTVKTRTPDILSIDRYEYEAEDGRLRVEAWSSAGGAAVLTLTGDGGLSLKLRAGDDGEYRLDVEGVGVFPGRITVNSSQGNSLKWHRKLDGVRE